MGHPPPYKRRWICHGCGREVNALVGGAGTHCVDCRDAIARGEQPVRVIETGGTEDPDVEREEVAS